jgi:hypothetical protein
MLPQDELISDDQIDSLFLTEHHPILVGVIFDLGNYLNLHKTKNVLIEFARSFESATEDKLYVYRENVRSINKWISQSVADIANYVNLKPIENLEKHILETLTIFSLEDFCKNKNIFYFTDRQSPNRHRRLEKGIRANSVNRIGCRFCVIDLANEPDDLLSRFGSNENCRYLHLRNRDELSADFLRGICGNI